MNRPFEEILDDVKVSLFNAIKLIQDAEDKEESINFEDLYDWIAAAQEAAEELIVSGED